MTADILARRSPMGELAERLAAIGGPDTVTFTERPFRVQVEIRTARSHDPASLADVLGLPLPTEVGGTTSAGERHALSLAPHWWLVTDRPETRPRLECALSTALRARGGLDVSAVDVSAQRTTIDIGGPYARDVLAHGCSLDLHPRVFAAGRCAQTMLARTQIVLHQLDDHPTYRVLVRASYAGHLARWLEDASGEYAR